MIEKAPNLEPLVAAHTAIIMGLLAKLANKGLVSQNEMLDIIDYAQLLLEQMTSQSGIPHPAHAILEQYRQVLGQTLPKSSDKLT